ncbi:MAG: hypothetical protein ACJAQT_003184 [Akkermansiaceae bacterium]|jgi:hypothetical protein
MVEFFASFHGGFAAVKVADIDKGEVVASVEKGEIEGGLVAPKAGAPDPGLAFGCGVGDDEGGFGSGDRELEVVAVEAVPLGGDFCGGAVAGGVGEEVVEVMRELLVAGGVGVDAIGGVVFGEGAGEVVEVEFVIGRGGSGVGFVDDGEVFGAFEEVGFALGLEAFSFGEDGRWGAEVDDDLRVGFAEFADDEEGVGLEVGVVLPVFSFRVLAGVICAESDDGEVGLEGEGLFEVGCFDEGAIGLSEDAEAAGGEGLDVVVFPEKMTEAGGVAVGFAWLCTGSECDGVADDGDFEGSGSEMEGGQEEEEEEAHGVESTLEMAESDQE